MQTYDVRCHEDKRWLLLNRLDAQKPHPSRWWPRKNGLTAAGRAKLSAAMKAWWEAKKAAE